MKQLSAWVRPWFAVMVAAFCAFTGCVTTQQPGGNQPDDPPPDERLRVGDGVTVIFSNVPPPGKQPHEEKIKENGTITPPQVGPVQAAGKTAAEIQKVLQDLYVPDIYRNATITVRGPDRYFFVGGDVRAPSRYPYTTGMTVVKAISTAGGFTDFARKKEINLTRASGKQFTINYEKAIKDPRFDRPVYPDDSIFVPKRRF